MKVFYYIIAHKNPEQLRVLVEVLKQPDSIVCIHVDKKSAIEDFQKAISFASNVYFVDKRYNVQWGAFSLTQAYIAGISEFIKSGADFFIPLSGEDFPVKKHSELIKFLSGNSHKNCITCEAVKTTWPDSLDRVKQFYFFDLFSNARARFPFLKTVINKAEGALNRFQRKLRVNRKIPFNYSLFGGSAWFVLNREACSYIYDFCVESNPLYSFFKYTACSDEHFFHTILGNSHLINTIDQNNLRYIKFPENSSNPVVLRSDSFNDLIYSGSYFARKFDIKADKQIIESLRLYVAG